MRRCRERRRTFDFRPAPGRVPFGSPRVGRAPGKLKGSDVNLATYLLLGAFRKDCDLAVVVSNDSGPEEPIRVTIRELGVPVGLANPRAMPAPGLGPPNQ